MSFQNLPVEINLQILKLLNETDIRSCKFLCKSLNKAATQMHLEELTYTGKNIRSVQSKKLLLEREDNRQNFDNGRWVKTLAIWLEIIDGMGMLSVRFSEDEEISLNSEDDQSSENSEYYQSDEGDEDDDSGEYAEDNGDGEEDDSGEVQQDDKNGEKDTSDEEYEDYQDNEPDNYDYRGTIYRFEKDEFLNLLSHLPNLKTLDLSSCKYHKYYLNTILHANTPCLERIEEIKKYNGSNRFNELHFLACYKFRKTITRLFLSHLKRKYFIGGQRGNYLFFLPDFENLTHLTIRKVDNENLIFTQFIEICSNLISLEFTSKGVYMDITRSATPLSNKYGQHLKTLKLGLNHLTPPYMSYLAHYPPDLLHTLHLKISNQDFCEWLNLNREDVLIAFAKGLSSINDFKICFPNDLDELQEPEEKETSVFYKILVSLKGDRTLRCDVKYGLSNCTEISIEVRGGRCICLTYQTDRYNSYSCPSDEQDGFSSDDEDDLWNNEEKKLFGDEDKLLLASPGEAMDVGDDPMDEDDEPLDENDELLDEEDGGFQAFKSNLDLHDSNSSIISIAPEIINSISYTYAQPSPIVARQMIKYITAHCPNIDYIDGYTNYLIIKAGPRKGLLYRKRSNNITATTQDNLKAVLLQLITLTPRLLQTVATYMPNVEVLLCNYPGWNKMSGNKKQNDYSMDAKLNLTRLEKLEEFYIDIEILLGCTVSLFIQFKYAGSDDMINYNLAAKPNTKYEHIAIPITAAYIERYKTTNPLRCKIVTIECNKDTKIMLHGHSSCNIIGIFYNGQLEIPSSLTFISPYYCNKVGVFY